VSRDQTSALRKERREEFQKYRDSICREFRRICPSSEVESEWDSMRGEFGLYSPRLDIAVGPFATSYRFIESYDRLMDGSQHLIQSLIDIHSTNVKNFDHEPYSLTFDQLRQKNSNSRCLLAIEIENRVSRKHLMGGAVNASALGRIGILVAWSPEKLKAAIKLRRYLEFLAMVGKNTFDTTNLLILSKEQLLDAVTRA